MKASLGSCQGGAPLIEQYREGQKDICVTFIDLEKACDRVQREEIWRTMRERLVPEKIC